MTRTQSDDGGSQKPLPMKVVGMVLGRIIASAGGQGSLGNQVAACSSQEMAGLCEPCPTDHRRPGLAAPDRGPWSTSSDPPSWLELDHVFGS